MVSCMLFVALLSAILSHIPSTVHLGLSSSFVQSYFRTAIPLELFGVWAIVMVAICTGVFHTPALMLMPCSLEFVPGFTLAEWSILPLIFKPC